MRVEVVLTESRELAVGVEAAAADGRREAVDLAGEQPVAVSLGSTVRPRLGERIRPEEVATQELDLVVRQVAGRIERWLERDEVVAALLEDDHGPPGGGEHVGHRRPAGTRTDDDGIAIEISHRPPPNLGWLAGYSTAIHPENDGELLS